MNFKRGRGSESEKRMLARPDIVMCDCNDPRCSDCYPPNRKIKVYPVNRNSSGRKATTEDLMKFKATI